jgi:hypothetical protein
VIGTLDNSSSSIRSISHPRLRTLLLMSRLAAALPFTSNDLCILPHGDSLRFRDVCALQLNVESLNNRASCLVFFSSRWRMGSAVAGGRRISSINQSIRTGENRTMNPSEREVSAKLDTHARSAFLLSAHLQFNDFAGAPKSFQKRKKEALHGSRRFALNFAH